jgi:hypothetical protein
MFKAKICLRLVILPPVYPQGSAYKDAFFVLRRIAKIGSKQSKWDDSSPHREHFFMLGLYLTVYKIYLTLPIALDNKPYDLIELKKNCMMNICVDIELFLEEEVYGVVLGFNKVQIWKR